MSNPTGMLLDESTEELEERQARIVWAAHILSYLTKQKPHVSLNHPPTTDEEGDEEEEIDPNDLDTATEANAILTDSISSIQSKFLDCIAQLLSPSKGWQYVTATAMRNDEEYTHIIVARNDCFRGQPFLWPKYDVFEFCIELKNYITMDSDGDAINDTTGTLASFEENAIGYCKLRVDYWTNQLHDILKSVSVLPDWDRRRWPGHEQAVNLWEELTELIDGTNRLKITELAYSCVSSTEVHFLLHVAFKPHIASKLWTSLKYLARPLTDCRLLRQIASRIPSLRKCWFSVLSSAPKTSVKPGYNVDITSAWARLAAAPLSPSDLKAITRFNEQFKRDCARANSLHAEMQIYDHLQNKYIFRSLTLPYFGGSKKSCLLCEDFLHALSPPITTRGRHGVCYPAWGVPCSNKEQTLTALKGLEKNLVSRIETCLRDSRGAYNVRATPPQVAQSSIVTGLSNMTLEGLQTREERAISTKKEEESRREERKIIEGHNVVAQDPSQPLDDIDPYNSCVMCNKTPAMLCQRCLSCYYCSQQCQKSDYHSHKLLCRQFANLGPRPSPAHKRAIFFPVERTSPKLIWILCTTRYSSDDEYFGGMPFETIDLKSCIGPNIETMHIEYNPRRNRRLGSGMTYWAPRKAGYSIAFKFRETFLIDGSTINGSLLESLGATASLSHPWAGPMLAIRELPSETYQDISLADFRHVLDFAVSYNTTEVRESDGSKSQTQTDANSVVVRGVKICCYGETKMHGSDPFVLVDVPKAHPTRLWSADGDISPLSKLLGMPLRLWKFPDLDRWLDPPGWESGGMTADSNQNAAAMMREMDPDKAGWGWASLYWSLDLGNVLAVRTDGQDLELDDVRAMCYFARKKLQPLMQDAMGIGLVSRTRKEVMDFVTWENMEKCKGEMMKDQGYLSQGQPNDEDMETSVSEEL